MFNGKIHYKWSFSIAMLVYQRVSNVWMNSRKKPSFGSATWFWGRWKFDKNLISTILVDEIRNIPLLLPLFNGQVEALWLWFNPKNRSSTSSEGKKIHACFRLYIYISICGWVKAFTAHLLPYVQNLETFIIFHWSVQAGGDDFPPIFRSCHIWQPQPSTLETPSDLRGGMAHVPPKGGKLTEFVVDF